MEKKTDIKVKQAHKVGGSVMLALTGFVKEEVFYKIALEHNQVILTPLDVR